MGDLDIRGGRFNKYPDPSNQPKPRKKVAGIEGKMVGDVEGPWDEDAIASGPGQATERMGTVKGAADFKPKKEVFGNRMKKIR
jgi:hypothetical protein